MIVATCSSCSFSALDGKQLEVQGEAFAKDSVQQVVPQWDSQAFLKRADPSLAAAGDPAELFKVFASKLGPIKKIGSLHRETYNASAGILVNRPDYVAVYKCSVDCQSGPATIVIGVIHKDNKWALSAFNVASKVLENMNMADRSESKSFVERIAPTLCGNLNCDVLKKYADPALIAEIGDSTKAMATNAMFLAISKTLGQFKKCDSPTARGFSLVQGQYYYNYVTGAEFEHGKAVASIVVLKHNGEWKLRGFHIQGHS